MSALIFYLFLALFVSFICNLEKVKINSISIENTLFLEISPNQTNIVLVEFNNQNFNLTFTKDLENKKIVLNN